MPGFSGLAGASAVIEQLALWAVAQQAIGALMAPAFTALTQDALKAHPDVVLTPDILARAVALHLADAAEAEADAAKSGVDASRFDLLRAMAKVRISPADLAEAVLRTYITQAAGEAEALPQGITAEQFQLMTDLAGDAIGPQQAAEALRRRLIPRDGSGAASVSFAQAIRESRLHDKWAPILAELERALLSPPDAAEAVVRGFLAPDAGAAIAELSGVDAATFAVMVHLAGDAPGPQQLAEALRRGAIPYDSGSPDKPGFVQGIREGRLADMWAPVIQALAQLWPTPTDALTAELKGQLTHDDAVAMYELLGGDIRFYPWLFNTEGESPTPLELLQLANRGIIPWTGLGPDVVSYAQGFKEGRWKDKWAEPYKRLGDYVPPESTVITLLSHGSITNERAAELLAEQGMDAGLIQAYLDEAHTEALSDYRGLTVSMVLSAYHDQIMSADDATAILEALHVTPSAVAIMLAYEDVQRAFQAVTAAITRIKTLFAARKIPAQEAADSLAAVGVPAAQIPQIMASWEIENSITVKTLTEAQIADAFDYGIMDQPTAIAELVNIGYTPFDAWVLLSVKRKTPQPDMPAGGPAPPQAQVVGGTT